MSWFDPIKNAAETVFADVHNIFAPHGFTQGNLLKLGADLEAGVRVDEQQIVIGIQSVALAINGVIPTLQKDIAEFQIIALAYPAAEPFIVDAQEGLAALQVLDNVLIAGTGNTDPSNIPQGIKLLMDAEAAVANFGKQLLAIAKNQGASTQAPAGA